MAINLQTKFANKVANKFYLDSVVGNKATKEFEFVGSESIKIIAPTTQEMKNYDRTSATARFGGIAELQDTVQTCTLTQDKSFDIGIDKGNYKEGNELKVAGTMLGLQNKEQAIPTYDAYVLGTWVTGAGASGTQAALTKSNIIEEIGKGIASLVNAKVNVTKDVYLYIGATNYAKLVSSPEFTNINDLGVKATETGVIGKVRGLFVVQVPDSYLPSTCNFLIAKKDSVLAPMTIKTLRILEDDGAIDGARLQGRYRYDGFVIEGRKGGVYACKNA